MKKEILSLLIVIGFTGCENFNKPTPPVDNKNVQQEQIVQKEHAPLKMDQELDEFYNLWKNTKYKAGGTSLKGIDSAALTQVFYKDRFNITIPRTAYKQSTFGVNVEKKDLEMGDILIFKRNKEFYSGVYMGEDKFIHSSFKGVKIDKLDKKPYKNIYKTARRVF